jgi:urease accessory protein
VSTVRSFESEKATRERFAMFTSVKTRNAVFAITILAFVVTFLQPEMAYAHTGTGAVGGFTSGFTHPLFGWDHVVAMVAVGLWGAFLGAPAIWILPIVFPLIMVLGGVLGILGVEIPAVETGIAASAIVLGLLVALAVRLPIIIAMLIVAAFAVFHGHAHGAELPTAANPVTYAIGFVLATGLLHLFGIAFGELSRWQVGRYAVQAGGLVIALVGGAFITGWM